MGSFVNMEVVFSTEWLSILCIMFCIQNNEHSNITVDLFIISWNYFENKIKIISKIEFSQVTMKTSKAFSDDHYVMIMSSTVIILNSVRLGICVMSAISI